MAPVDAGGGVEQPRKAHRVAKSGAKAQKRKGKGKGAAGDDEGGERKNPKVRTGPAAYLVSLSGDAWLSPHLVWYLWTSLLPGCSVGAWHRTNDSVSA
jgi:hypothetical protein